MVRDFLEGRRGRGSTARRNPAVTHGRIELFIVMAGCSASLCVGVGRVRGPPVRGRILSLLLPLSTIILPFLPPSLLSFHSFFSPLDFGIYKYRYREGGLSAPIYNTAALFLQLSRAPPPCHSTRLLVLLSPPLPLLLSPHPRPFCNVCNGPPTPGVWTPLGVQHLPTWPRHNCIRARPTVLTRSTHRDCPRAPPWTTGTTH